MSKIKTWDLKKITSCMGCCGACTFLSSLFTNQSLGQEHPIRSPPALKMVRTGQYSFQVHLTWNLGSG